jgi:hypothetical protein
MSQIDSVVSQLQAERENLLDSFSRIDHVLKPLSILSAAARAKIAAAQRPRWPKREKAKKR